jgi:hypothetical protein
MLEGVRSRIRLWEADMHQAGQSPEEVRECVAGRVSFFLGERAARKVLEPVGRNNQNLLAVVEPVLGEFLGQRAAARVVNGLVEAILLTR